MKDKNKGRSKCIEEITYYKYADNELDPQERQKVKNHLESCAACRVFVAGITAENTALKELFSYESGSPDLTPALMRRLNRKKSPRLYGKHLAYAATFILTVLLFVFLIINKANRTRPEVGHVMIRSARVEGKITQPHIFAAKNPDVTFIWLEKSEPQKEETEGTNETII